MVSQNIQVLIYQMQYINIEVTNTDITFTTNSANKNIKKSTETRLSC